MGRRNWKPVLSKQHRSANSHATRRSREKATPVFVHEWEPRSGIDADRMRIVSLKKGPFYGGMDRLDAVQRHLVIDPAKERRASEDVDGEERVEDQAEPSVAHEQDRRRVGDIVGCQERVGSR